jgi:hypothetical protein
MEKQLSYVAHCIEHGDVFSCEFRSKHTEKDLLKEVGSQLASMWGAECIKVEHLRLERDEKLEDLYDADNSKYVGIQ